MDKAAGTKSVIAKGAHFKGQIKNARAIEVNGVVEADLTADKVTIGSGGKFVGAINAELVVISGHYDGAMDAGSIWATATAKISGKIQYKTLQMDRGAALNCRVVHNWKAVKEDAKKAADEAVAPADKAADDKDVASKGTDQNDGKGAATDAPATEGASPDTADQDAAQKMPADDAKLRMLAETKTEAEPAEKKSARSRRLGIFGFGSKSNDLDEMPGKKA